ncbi:hypothetical protein VTL71DRAFT_1013 [Oculimacula yallundae]|uniref:Uncharacterized protein n=1 Tax=Oculimacula yallundae TaxID=86028 RepID=A0ABR4D1W4_9HELO
MQIGNRDWFCGIDSIVVYPSMLSSSQTVLYADRMASLVQGHCFLHVQRLGAAPVHNYLPSPFQAGHSLSSFRDRERAYEDSCRYTTKSRSHIHSLLSLARSCEFSLGMRPRCRGFGFVK